MSDYWICWQSKERILKISLIPRRVSGVTVFFRFFIEQNLCITVEQSQWFGKYKLLNLWALKWKEYVWSVLACKQLQFTSSSSVFESRLASGNSPILSHTLSLLLLCRKVSDQLGEGMGCRDYRQTETKIGGASWVNLLWEIRHKQLQTIVVVSVCKKLHCKPKVCNEHTPNLTTNPFGDFRWWKHGSERMLTQFCTNHFDS